MQTNLDIEQTKRLLATASFVRGHQTTLTARKHHHTLFIFSSFSEQIGLFLSLSCMCRHCRMMHSAVHMCDYLSEDMCNLFWCVCVWAYVCVSVWFYYKRIACQYVVCTVHVQGCFIYLFIWGCGPLRDLQHVVLWTPSYWGTAGARAIHQRWTNPPYANKWISALASRGGLGAEKTGCSRCQERWRDRHIIRWRLENPPVMPEWKDRQI